MIAFLWLLFFLSCIPSSIAANFQSCQDIASIDQSGMFSMQRENFSGEVYCDVRDGVGYQLMTHFAQNYDLQKIADWNANSTDRRRFFVDGIWIHGASAGRPQNSSEYAPDGPGLLVQSFDWRLFLQVGWRYKLRQQIFKTDFSGGVASQILDVAWDFVFTGYTFQNEAPSFEYQVWPLFNRRVLNDTTGNQWADNPWPTYFAPPYDDSESVPYLTGCGKYDYSFGSCLNVPNPTARSNRLGSAGIIRRFNATAATWAPMTLGDNEPAYIDGFESTSWGFHQSGSLYRHVNYYIAEIGPGTYDADPPLPNPKSHLMCPNAPTPLAEWTFETDASDTFGNAIGSLQSGAIIKNGTLVLNGQGAFLETNVTIASPMRSHSLEVGVYLDTLYQEDRCAMSINLFDVDGNVTSESIRFSSSNVKAWSFHIPGLSAAIPNSENPDRRKLTRLIYTWDFDPAGFYSFTFYRDGVEVGSTMSAATTPNWSKAIIAFGKGSTQPSFTGRIEYARLWNVTLTSDDIRLLNQTCDVTACDAWVGAFGSTCDVGRPVVQGNFSAGTTEKIPITPVPITIQGDFIGNPQSTLVFSAIPGNFTGNSNTLLSGTIQVEGTVYASGNLNVSIPFQLENGNYTIWLMTFSQMNGTFNLNVQVENSTQKNLCNYPSSLREKNRFGILISTQECRQDFQVESSRNMMPVIVGATLGGIVLILIVAIVLILILKNQRSKKETENDFQLENFEENGNDLKIGKKLGSGNFGEVSLGIWRGNQVACKKMMRDEDDQFYNEVSTLAKVTHPNIVQYFGVAKSNDTRWIIMEYLAMGSAKSLCDAFKLKQYTLLDIACQCAAGMIHLSEKKIMHRDLALRNILLAEGDMNILAKLSDFGLSQTGNAVADSVLPIRWTAPEVMVERIFTEKSDVWSFGILLWELFSAGQIPYSNFSSNQVVLEQVLKGHRLTPPESVPQAVKDVMCQCWEEDPESRPTFQEISRVLQLERDKVVATKPNFGDMMKMIRERT